MTKDDGAQSEHPLFRAMVVMGGSLAVGCSGTTAMGESQSGPHTTSGSGGSANSADAAATGPVEPQCVSAQWICDPDQLRCVADGWEPPSNCACDPTRPNSPADCASGELFTCRQATHEASGQQPPSAQSWFECSCVPKTDDCSDACKAALPSNPSYSFVCSAQTLPIGDIVLCGCALVILR